MKFAVPFSDIVEIIMIADKPLSAGEIRDAFHKAGHLDHPITDEEWRKIADHIQMNVDEGDSMILIDGEKRGRKYYLEGMTWIIPEELADQAYQVLYESPTELRWKEIESAVGYDMTIPDWPMPKRTANIQRILKQKYPDVIKGSKRGLWAIDGLHEIPELKAPEINYCWHCGVKL